MSTETVNRIFETYKRKLDGIDRVEDGLGMLRDLVEDIARSHAETVFLKVHTEAGWDLDATESLMKRVFHEHAMSITETVHAKGGTLEMVEDLVVAASEAYGGRFLVTHGNLGIGGAA